MESDLAGREAAPQPFHGYYTAYYVVTGAMLGMFGAATSLLFNVIGSYLWSEVTGKEQHPLRLIQVYLTFPLGATALDINSGVDVGHRQLLVPRHRYGVRRAVSRRAIPVRARMPGSGLAWP